MLNPLYFTLLLSEVCVWCVQYSFFLHFVHFVFFWHIIFAVIIIIIIIELGPLFFSWDNYPTIDPWLTRL